MTKTVMTKTIVNPWLNVSLADTVADCDKEVVNGLTGSIKDALELRTLPEPFHGNPAADVYLLCGNPGNGEADLNFVGINKPVGGFRNIYEKEMCEDLWHKNQKFLWLRDEETVIDAEGNPYPGYKWWKMRCRKLAEVLKNVAGGSKSVADSVFCVEYFRITRSTQWHSTRSSCRRTSTLTG